jgi:Protein of unknown function (DUF2905)
MAQLGKALLVLGAVLMLVGGVVLAAERLGLGRLPGDLSWQGKHGSFHFPLMTSLIISVVLTVLLNLWLRNR